MQRGCTEKNLLVTYAEHEVDESEKSLIERHIANCAECHKELRQIQGTLNLLRGVVMQNIPVPTPEEWEQFELNLSKQSRRAAEVAQTLESLRKERQRIGFTPIPFADYIRGLAKGVGISLEAVLARFGITDLSQPNRSSARAFAQLARELGFSLRETLVQIRIGFAEQLGVAPILAHGARHRSDSLKRNQLEVSETTLQELESEYDLETVRELRSIETEIRAVYEAEENTST